MPASIPRNDRHRFGSPEVHRGLEAPTEGSKAIPLQPGSFVQLARRDDSTTVDTTYQVISVDDDADRCWVRRWPLSKHGSPSFAVPLHQAIPFHPLNPFRRAAA